LHNSLVCPTHNSALTACAHQFKHSLVKRRIQRRNLKQKRNHKVIWEEPRRHPSLRQRITTPQSPRWLQWNVPHLPPNCPFPFDDHHPHSTEPTHHPKRHPDPVSRLSTVHSPDRPTETRDWPQVCTKSRLRLILNDAAKNNKKRYVGLL